MTLDFTDIAAVSQVMVDRCLGRVQAFSNDQADALITQALVAANNGKTFIDVRDIRDGKCGQLFTLLETVLKKIVVEGIQGDEYFNTLVETRVVAQGDKPEFDVVNADWFHVTKMAAGTQSLRRQKVTGSSKQTIPTYWYGVKIFEEMTKVLAGQANIADAMRTVAKSFKQEMLAGVYTMFAGATTAQLGGATYNQAGSYDEATLITLIDHVEAKTGNKATIIGTRAALRKISSGVTADSAKEDMYNMGYYGKFNGTPMMRQPQRHNVGADTFLIADDVVTVLAGPTKPIKLVIEGNPLIVSSAAIQNQDLTQEYLYGQQFGIGFILSDGAIGRYTIS